MMLIGDGVTPGNEARGYVLRRLLRRAVRSMRLLGVEDRGAARAAAGQPRRDGAVLPRAAPRTGSASPRSPTPRRTRSAQTLRTGTTIFDLAAAETKAAGGTGCRGDKAFALHDTYGFPIDLTLEMAAEQGLAVDEDGLPPADDRAARPRQGGREGEEGPARRRLAPTARSPTRWAAGRVHRLRRGRLRGDGRAASSAATAWSPRAREGDEVELVLDRTPFYAEGGGQLADQGVIELGNGARVEVRDVQSPIPGLIVHRAQVLAGEVDRRGRRRRRSVDVERRRSISRAHTATHMVHKAFREALGETATQAGLGERAGPVPLRLLRDRRGARVGAGRRRGAGQRPGARRPGGARRDA